MTELEKKVLTKTKKNISKIQTEAPDTSELAMFITGAGVAINPNEIEEELAKEIGFIKVEQMFQKQGINHYYIAGYNFGYKKVTEMYNRVSKKQYNSTEGHWRLVTNRFQYQLSPKFFKATEAAYLKYVVNHRDNTIDSIIK